MTCDQMQPLLEAFADRELGWGTAWRVRHHLAACPACMAELAELQRLTARVRAWRDMPAPAGLQSQIAAALPSVPPASAPRRPMTARRAAVGLAGVAAAIAAFFWLTPGQPGRPTIAFADVERAMASVNIMAWTTEVTDYNKNGTVKDHYISRTWMRRSPLAQATMALPEPSHPQGLQTLEDERGFLDILPNGKGIVWRGRTNVSQTVAAYLSLFTGPLRMLEKGQFGEKGQTGDLEQTTLNGKPALKVVLLDHIPNELRNALWIDPVTKRVIQMETRSTANGKLEYVVTNAQMRYDETPPSGVFDIVPPPGAKIKNLPERTKQSHP